MAQANPAGETGTPCEGGAGEFGPIIRALTQGQVLRVEKPAGNLRVEVVSGTLWVTQTGDGGDHVVQAKESFEPHGRGMMLAEAIGGPAVVRWAHKD